MILPVNLITAGTSTELSVGQKASPIALLSPRLKSIDQARLALNLLVAGFSGFCLAQSRQRMALRGLDNPRDWLVRHGCFGCFLNLIVENLAEAGHLFLFP